MPRILLSNLIEFHRYLVVEQPQRCVREYHIMLIRCFDALCIHHAPSRRGKVLHSTPPRTMHVVGEREECITRTRYAIKLGSMLLALLRTEWSRHFLI